MSTSQDQKLSRGALIALVVGSMIGSGIFALPSAFGRSTGGLGALIAWAIAGTGMLMLALVFQTLSMRRPDLDTGIYAYAKAGFGNYLGFASAVGYWIGCCLADVACLVLIKATLGQFFPVFGRVERRAARYRGIHRGENVHPLAAGFRRRPRAAAFADHRSRQDAVIRKSRQTGKPWRPAPSRAGIPI